jgi:hypothetical protein
VSGDDYILIDLDQEVLLHGSSGKIFGVLAHEKVQPFNPSKIIK